MRVFIIAIILSFRALDGFGEQAPVHIQEKGAAIYRTQCASCHGDEGQGVAEEYDEPLAGRRSIPLLARLIERSMPEDEPDQCVGDDAQSVAEYIYHAFYSPEAQKKKGAGPRIELARLTEPQYRNVVADLLGTFTPSPRDGNNPPESGLRAQYYQSKGMNKANELELERVDQRIDFNFGECSPHESITADQFAVIWQGALAAHETGHYEFRVRTENGVRLYLNMDNLGNRRRLRDDSSVAGQEALIDGWVSSGEMREHTARVHLLGGREYPLRLEFFKYKEETASVLLEWKPPHGVWAALDHRFVNTGAVPRTFVVETPFPADDRSLGYERGSSVSKAWLNAASNAAIETASEVVNRLPILARFEQGDPDRLGNIREFILRFAEAGWRRPLTDAEKELLGASMFAHAENPEAAARRAVLFVLGSPSFLYADLTPEGEAPSPYAVASRLSLTLWDSLPDEALLDAARDGRLAAREHIESQARRMIRDPRSKAKMQGFFEHWLELEERDLSKDKTMFPQYDEKIVADLRYSLELFLDDVVWSEQSDYRQLLLADYLFLNEPLRRLYQTQQDAPVSEDLCEEDASEVDFEPYVFHSNRRAGVLTHPYLLSAFAYHNNTSPIHRGVFLTRNIIGRGLKPPPMAVAFKDSDFPEDITMREKITQLTRDQACMSCHSVINPLGFALENYDAVGRWRTREKDKPLNTKSDYVTEEGRTLQVQSARDIANFAATNESAHRAFVTQIFHHLVKQDPYAYGTDTAERLRLRFAENEFSIKNLMIDIAVLAAGHHSNG